MPALASVERKHHYSAAHQAQLADFLGLSDPDHARTRSEFKLRFLELTLEAFRRDEISLGKVRWLVKMVGLAAQDVDQLLHDAGIGINESLSP